MLVHDSRPGPGQPTPGLHALVIGISHYRHLPGGLGAPASVSGLDGLAQLSTTARTASDLATFLQQQASAGTLERPLQTLRLLLAPSPNEPNLPATEEPTYGEVRKAMNEWRADSSLHRDSMSLMFYSGHGVGGTLDDAILLASDFADPAAAGLLDRVISGVDLRNGMRPPYNPADTIASRQIYLWDACRNRPKAFDQVDWTQLSTIWDQAVQSGEESREIAELFASFPGQMAFEGPAGELTVFGQALIECLQGAAAEVDSSTNGGLCWTVSTTDVSKRLQGRIDERNKVLSTTQRFRGGDVMSFPVMTYQQAPRVDVELSIVPPADPQTGVTFEYRSEPPDTQVVQPLQPNPKSLNLPMGTYKITLGSGQTKTDILRPPNRQLALPDA